MSARPWKPRLTNRFEEDALLARILGVRAYHGWNPTTLANLPTRLMCVVAELREVMTALSAEERAEELADVAMYLVVMLHDLYDGPWPARSYRTIEFRDEIHQHTERVRAYLVTAFECWRRVDQSAYLPAVDRVSDIRISLELALLETCRAADAMGVDLDHQMHRKVTLLYERERRHGGKHPDS